MSPKVIAAALRPTPPYFSKHPRPLVLSEVLRKLPANLLERACTHRPQAPLSLLDPCNHVCTTPRAIWWDATTVAVTSTWAGDPLIEEDHRDHVGNWVHPAREDF